MTKQAQHHKSSIQVVPTRRHVLGHCHRHPEHLTIVATRYVKRAPQASFYRHDAQ
jgi:hypothetical protein